MESYAYIDELKSQLIKKLNTVAALASQSRDERAKYDESLKILRDRLSEIAYAEKKGKEEGKAEMARNLYAEKKGKEEGKAEMARNLKAMGVPIEAIAKASGLSIEEIEQL